MMMSIPQPDKPATFTTESVPLVFTSELALKRSIRLKYPGLTKDQWKATFDDQKKYIGWKESDLDGCHIGK